MFSADITVHQVLMYDIIVPVFYLGLSFPSSSVSLLLSPFLLSSPSLPPSLHSKREKGSGLPHHSWGDEVVLLVDGQRFPVHPRLFTRHPNTMLGRWAAVCCPCAAEVQPQRVACVSVLLEPHTVLRMAQSTRQLLAIRIV